ncbi:MAG: transposase [Muribaculaceae bacterium]|nr:transposase [Muribaculaceae bacterium]
MEIIDEYYLDHPTTGVKTMTMVLREKDYTVNEKRVRRLMRKSPEGTVKLFIGFGG